MQFLKCKMAVSLAIFFIIANILLGEEIDIFKYSSKGQAGYTQFNKDFIANEKKEFWNNFVVFIRTVDEKRDYEKILKSRAFWNEYKQDPFFASKSRDDLFELSFQDIQKRFDSAAQSFWREILNSMRQFKRIDTDIDILRMYTQNDENVRKLQQYKQYYQVLNPIRVPVNDVEIQNVSATFANLLKVVGVNNVNGSIRKEINGYLDSWQIYYKLPNPENVTGYDEKAKAYRAKKEQLLKIRKTANINFFHIKNHIAFIDTNIRDHGEKEGYFAAYHNFQQTYDKFMGVSLLNDEDAIAKYPDLIVFKNKMLIISKSLQPLDERLRKIVSQLNAIPGENDLNGLEVYYSTYKNDQDTISRIVNTNFNYRLWVKVEALWKNGLGSDANSSWKDFKGTVEKYKTYFGNTGYEDKIEFLVDYYTNRSQSNPGLIANVYQQVKNCGFPEETLHHMEQKWRVKSLQELGASYEEYVNDFAKTTFSQAKDGSQKGKSEFDALIEVYELAVKDMPDFSLAPPWNSVFSQFKNYYYGSNNKKDIVNSIENISKEAAIAYGLSGLPVQKPLTSTKTGVSDSERAGGVVSNTKNEFIPFLEDLWAYMQNTHNYKGNKIVLFQEILSVNRKSMNGFSEIQGLPLDFDYEMYDFVWICFYYKDGQIEKKQRATDILDSIKKKNEITWKWLKGKYDRIF